MKRTPPREDALVQEVEDLEDVIQDSGEVGKEALLHFAS